MATVVVILMLKYKLRVSEVSRGGRLAVTFRTVPPDDPASGPENGAVDPHPQPLAAAANEKPINERFPRAAVYKKKTLEGPYSTTLFS